MFVSARYAVSALVVTWMFTPRSNAVGPSIRIVTYNVAGLGGSGADLRAVFEALMEDPDPLTGVLRAPDAFVFQEVSTATTLATLEEHLDAAAPPGVDYEAATFTANGGGGGEQALLYRVDSLIEITSGHRDIRDHSGPRAIDRWRLQCQEDSQTLFHVYGAHFKAGEGSEFEAIRATEADAIRRDADALGDGALLVYAGDWNLYSSDESAFQRFFDVGSGRAIDPKFSGNFAGALCHTQSPHDGSDPDLVTGGLDDRFDFQLSTEECNDGAGFDVALGSYRSFGNDGEHFDRPVNDGVNAYFATDEQWKAHALARASDHLPVIVDYAVPSLARLTLEVDALQAGGRADLSVHGAKPSSAVYFVYSVAGLGETHVDALDVTLRLQAPILLARLETDSGGRAVHNVLVPDAAGGREAWFQAAQTGVATDVVWRGVR